MSSHERIIQLLNISVLIVLFFLGCAIGKLITDNWFVFNGIVIGIIFVCDIIWQRLRKKLVKRYDQ